MKQRALATLIACLSVLSIAHAASLEGIPFDDTITVEDEELVLNGLGPRYATLAKFRVYVAGLYVPKKTGNAEDLIAADGKRHMVLVFQRKVSAAQARDAWKEGFAKARKAYPVSEEATGKLLGAMADAGKGDKMVYAFDGDSVEISIRDESRAVIEDGDLVKALFAVWLKHPPNKEFAKGLLGK